ncbi:MAG: Sec-independent protein translocase protein TatB [Chromatiales bacterium]|jgi:sec-independent protein translocase protein TatB|nr:Sec-independent protein translocase protein TatB [Chromatiales bacterium]
MFEIGFWEMVLVGVVALVVVGPKDLPILIRTVGKWVGRARSLAGEFKNEFDREVARTEELKKLVERETSVAEVHKAIEDARKSISLEAQGTARSDSAVHVDSSFNAGANTNIGDAALCTGDSAAELTAGRPDDERPPR